MGLPAFVGVFANRVLWRCLRIEYFGVFAIRVPRLTVIIDPAKERTMPTFLCGHGNWYPKNGFAPGPGGYSRDLLHTERQDSMDPGGRQDSKWDDPVQRQLSSEQGSGSISGRIRLYRLRWREADRRSEIHFSRVHACRVECPETRQLVACRREFVSIQGTAPLLSRLRHRSGFGEPGAD